MSAGRISGRVARLEAMRLGSWKAWEGVPLQQWPDDALHGYLGHSLGLSAEAVAALSEEDLRRLTLPN